MMRKALGKINTYDAPQLCRTSSSLRHKLGIFTIKHPIGRASPGQPVFRYLSAAISPNLEIGQMLCIR